MSAREKSGAEAKDFSEFVGECKESLVGLLFWPVATETDRGVDIAGVTVMEEIDDDVIVVGVGTGAIVVVGVDREASSLLNETRYIILPVKVFGRLGGGNIDAKNKTICTTMIFIE